MMEAMRTELDSIQIPLDGLNLIEAAAGTGKTHNIQNLAARLIVEHGLTIGQIVVVTFTEAAAAELGERLRTVLAGLLGAVDRRPPEDPVQRARAEALLARFAACGIAPDRQRARLQLALRDFDDANVSTLHGFCGRVLSENAFESGVAFQARLEKNLTGYVEKLLGDFCRSRRYGNSPLPGVNAVRPEELLPTVLTVLGRPNLRLSGSRSPDDSAAMLEQLWTEALAALRSSWRSDLLTPLYGRLKSGYAEEELDEYAAALDALLAEAQPDGTRLAARLTPLLPGNLLAQARKRPAGNEEAVAAFLAGEPFFALAGRCCDDLLPRCRNRLRRDAIDFVREKLAEWKARDNFQGFDDLLLRVRDALAAPDGRLAAALRRRFKAGIIDEFQDTDPVQYEIFRTIFAERDDPAFFMVGDPRQAIYSFRGGDLATYLEAARETAARHGKIYTLSANYRSSGALIRAVNAVFAGHALPFAEPEIRFGEVVAPLPEVGGLTLDGAADRRPLGILHRPEWKIESCIAWCADTILSMLENDWRLPSGRRLAPGDFAVLCYDGFELSEVRRAMHARRIPVISVKSSSVWQSPEAQALLTVLDAVLNPADSDRIKRALLTGLGGMTPAELAGYLGEGDFLSESRAEFAGLLKVWRKHGFQSLLRRIFSDFRVRRRVMAQPGGERVLSNYGQLGDLLGAEASRRALSPCGTVKLLRDSMRNADHSVEANLEQLETDRSAVKLLTIHAAKGLQFPVVLLPGLFRWYPGRRGDRGVYHVGKELCYDLGGDDAAAAAQSEREELQELLRLVYVAITRAQYACRICWGSRTGRDRKPVTVTPLDWLFRMRHFDGGAETALAELTAAVTLPEIPPELLLETSEVPLRSPVYRPEPPDLSGCACLEPEPAIARNWRLVSYSSLPWQQGGTMATAAEPEPDYDAGDIDEPAGPVAAGPGRSAGMDGIMAIPGGAAIGNAWHKILEDCTLSDLPAASLCAETLRRFGFTDPATQGATAAMLKSLAATVLPCGAAIGRIAPERCLRELEFMFAVPHGFGLEAVCAAVEPYWRKQFGNTMTPEAGFTLRGGFFNGFIDMVFEHEQRYYIIDWKSNRLGGDPAAFAPGRLGAAMVEHAYPMQYLIYLAALVKYLRLRLGGRFGAAEYERYIGEVYYIFLRGVALDEPGFGIFAARPDYGTVAVLEKALNGGCDVDV